MPALFAFSCAAFLAACLLIASMRAEEKKEPCFFSSLHHTGEGMRFWYEENGGFMDITGVPYSDKRLDCQNCHVKSCDPCHAQIEGETCTYSLDRAKKQETCLACHKREGATYKIGNAKNKLDVHAQAGMECMDCHTATEVHGNGTKYRSMRDEGAVQTKCTTCHKKEEDDAIRPHKVHKGKLDCAACHVENTTTCLNCHFTSVMEKGTRAGNFFAPTQEWILLINYNGKITSGNAQTLVHEGKPFITYAPFFTHAVQKEARECTDCHANDAVNLIIDGKSVPMAKFKDGEFESWNGVVPLVPDQLEWDFLDREGDAWVPITFEGQPATQFSCYGTPLTDNQLKKMAMPFKK